MHQHAAREKWMLNAVYFVNMSARVLYVCARILYVCAHVLYIAHVYCMFVSTAVSTRTAIGTSNSVTYWLPPFYDRILVHKFQVKKKVKFNYSSLIFTTYMGSFEN